MLWVRIGGGKGWERRCDAVVKGREWAGGEGHLDGEDKAEIKAVKGFLMGKEEGTRARQEYLRWLK